MFKNIIIVFLVYLLASLMIQKPENVDLVVKDAATAKHMVVDGVDYVHKTFDKEFSVHSDEEYKEEHGEERGEDKTSFNPFQQNKSATSNVFIKEQRIVEDTWFNEK